jgi:heme/copper-type cytochrome/quinol oxidase subunit 2
MKVNKWFVFLAMLGVLFALPLVNSINAAAEPVNRELTITAKSFGYEPATFSVNEGDHVYITLVAEDVSHGFYLDGYDINIVARPRENAKTDFVANKGGNFRYRCSETCGAMHPFMIGQMTVEPNSPLNVSLGLSGLAMVGTLAYVKLRKEKK